MTRNYFVSFENGDSCLVYVTPTNIGASSIKKFAEKSTGEKVIEVYHVPQEELQYYCIGGRVWIDTDEKVQNVLNCINS